MMQTQEQLPKQENSRSLHPVLVRLFQKRDMSPRDVQEFLSWDLKDLPDITQLKDMEKASQRIIHAIDNCQQIAIYGDYDVDGTTSCAVLYHFFKMLNIEVKCIQPSRFVEGYGLHVSSIDQAIEAGIDLLITVDCGISNVEAAAYAKEKKLDLIITDHHKDGADTMPEALAVINPSRRDEAEHSPLKSMAGVCVAFALATKVRQDLLKSNRECPSLYPLLQFVAIGTICDLVPLNTLNIRLVRHGLAQMGKTTYPGIKVFFTPQERQQAIIDSEKLSFQIGPMINSKGRLDHPEKALELLTSQDIDQAYSAYNHLDIANKERKFIQAEVFDQARQQVLKEMKSEDVVASIVYQSDWHEGVIGIVASKLVESFKVPAIVFTDAEEEGIIKASARTAGALSIYQILQEQSDLFLKFGGHKAAAGLSMPKENFETFKQRVSAAIAQTPEIERTVVESYDLDIRPHEIDPQLVKDLELLGPYGRGNEKPIFKMKDFVLENYTVLKDVHVRWNLRGISRPDVRLQGISFNYIGKFGCPHPEELFKMQNQEKQDLSALFTLGINRFNGNEYIQLMIQSIS